MACFSTSYADHYYIYMHSQLIVSLDCSIILGLEYAKKATKSLWEHPFFIVSIILIFCLLLWLLCLYRNPLFSCFSRSNLIVSTFYFSLNPLHTSFVQIEICFDDIFTWLNQVTRFMRYTQITHSTKTKVFL